MLPILLTIVAICCVIPTRYVAAALPAIWAIQSPAPTKAVVILTVGSVDLLTVDLLLIMLTLRFVIQLALGKELIVNAPIYAAFAIFLAVNLAATFFAGIKFGSGHVTPCIVSWVRLVSEVLLIPILAQTITTLGQARRCLVIMLLTLGALAAIQFINLAGASHGFAIGEVQGAERGELRYFGPLGDSIGFVLLLGYLISLCYPTLLGAAAFLGGILLTGGVGAMFGAGVGTLLFALFGMRGASVRAFIARHAWLLPALLFAAAIAAAVVAKPLASTLLDRVSSGTYEQSGTQRLDTARVAAAMIADNLFSGVGFMGFQHVLPEYGGEKYFDLSRPDGATANANNQLLQSLTDSGIAGLAATGLLIFCIGRLFARLANAKTSRLISTVYLAALLWLLSQVFGNLAAVWLIPASYVARFLWLLIGIGIAVDRLLASEPEAAAAAARQNLQPAPATGLAPVPVPTPAPAAAPAL